MKIFGLEIKRESTTSSSSSSTTTSSASGANWLEHVVSVTTEAKAMQIGVVNRCVNLISDGIAVMPLMLKHRETASETFRDMSIGDPEHWYYLVNVKPNARMNGYVFKKNIITNMLLKGNAYVMALNEWGKPVKINSGLVDQLILLHDNANYDIYRNRYVVNDTVYGITGTFTPDYMLHFKNPSHDGGLLGDSTIANALKVLSILATGNEMQLKNFATDGRGKFVLGYEEAKQQTWAGYDQTQMQGSALDVEEQLATHDIVTLPRNGLDLKPLNFSADQMQFGDTYKTAIEEVTRFFGVPLYKITGSTSNYKTVDAAQVDFYNEGLQPYCSQVECEFHSKVTDRSDWYKYKFDFDETPLFTLDMATKSQWMKAQMEMGVKSVNDLRAEMDIDPVDGGDELLMSANLKTLKQLKSEGDSNSLGQ